MALRNTIQRELIFKAVMALACHATADEVYAAVSRQHPTISRATVYRNLNVLAEEGKIRKLAIPEGADRFDQVVEEHYHLRCERCGRVFDVEMDCQINLECHIHTMAGFVITGHDLTFRGICPECGGLQRAYDGTGGLSQK